MTDWGAAATMVRAALPVIDRAPRALRLEVTPLEIYCGGCGDWLVRVVDVPGVPARILRWWDIAEDRKPEGHEEALRQIEREQIEPYERGRRRALLRRAPGYKRSVRRGARVWAFLPWPVPAEQSRDAFVHTLCRCQSVDVPETTVAEALATRRRRVAWPPPPR